MFGRWCGIGSKDTVAPPISILQIASKAALAYRPGNRTLEDHKGAAPNCRQMHGNIAVGGILIPFLIAKGNPAAPIASNLSQVDMRG